MSRWLIESSANFYAGKYINHRYYKDAYAYTTANPHLALWQYGYYKVRTYVHIWHL